MAAYGVRLYRSCLHQIPIAIGIWCQAADLETAAKEVVQRLQKPYEAGDIRKITDPIELDQYLADYVTWLCPSSVLAAGAAIRAWQNGPRTGGIIGSLGAALLEIDESMAEILPGVWCLSYSGGPGLIFEGDKQTAWKVREYLNYPGVKQDWPSLKAYLQEHGVTTYLYVADGSGGAGLLAKGDREKEEQVCLSVNNN